MALRSSLVTSCLPCYLQSCLRRTAILLFLWTIFFPTMVYCSKPDSSYSTHCASVVPESIPRDPEYTTLPFPPNQNGFYLGGDGIINKVDSDKYYYSSSDRKTLLFQTHHVYGTDIYGVYKVEAILIIPASGMNYYAEDLSYSYSFSPQVIHGGFQSGPFGLKLEGFWSKFTGKLCMVGSSSYYSPEGKPRVLTALLKLHGVRSPNSITSLVKGTLDSLSSADDSSYFKPLSLFMFPKVNYKYSEVTKGFDYGCKGGINVPKSLSLSLPLSQTLCSMFSQIRNAFELEYASGCNSTKSCSPFGDEVGFLPQFMFFSLIQCSSDRQSLRFLVEFQDSSYVNYLRSFEPTTILIAEGSWDPKKNQLCAVACRLMDANNSLNSSHVEDCSIRLSLRFSSVWSITYTNGVVGDIWSLKNVNDSGYFNRLKFHIQGDFFVHGIPGLKYDFTLVDRAKNSCPKKPSTNKREQYPDWKSNDMHFDMSVKTSNGKSIGYGYSKPMFLGDQIAPWNQVFLQQDSSSRQADTLLEANVGHNSQLNISYRMNFPSLNSSSNDYEGVQILAEGIYDNETGDLCMVGCKHLGPIDQISVNASVDCEIFVKIQFPPMNSYDCVKGVIESTREKSDPLYFESLSFSAVSPYSRHERKSVRRMNLEIIMTLISYTFVCVFAVYQILYVRKHPGASPFISLLMLVVLTLGNMIPLVLNFEAFLFTTPYHRRVPRRTAGWLEINEVLVRVLTMIAFFLLFRLSQIVWSVRLANGNRKASWVAEKRTLYVCLPLYIAGGIVAVLVNWRNNNFGDDRVRSVPINNHQHSLWVDLRSYAGLILDGFLFPQILLNILNDSKETALSRFFYIGTTFVRLLPHAYDLYRTHFYNVDFDWSYMYANRSADFYSTAWDVIIALGCLFFATIVYLQQCFRGRFFLPKRFKKLEVYEKVPVVSEA